MAIITIGPPLSGIRGTIGGIVYSENGSGPYATQWAKPSNPQSHNQTTQRGYFGQIPQLWNDLTTLQKAAWTTFAALPAQELTNSLGEAYYASAFNWFCKCNVRLFRVGLGSISAVPTQARPTSPTVTEFRVCEPGSDPDLCSGGTPSADSYGGTDVPAKAFDDDTGTWWQAAATGFPHWLRYDLPISYKIKKFSITPPPHTANVSPDAFTFQSWNGLSWDTLLTVTPGTAWVIGETRDYYLPTPSTARSDYRLNITGIQGGGNQVAIAELELFLANADNSVLIYPEDEFAAAPTDYDLILHIAPGVSIGKNVQYPGFLEVLALTDPGRQAAPFQDEIEAAFGTILGDRAWFAQTFCQTEQGIRSAPQSDRTETA